MITGIFWPITRKNYFFWPMLALIPLMVGDVITTTLAIRSGFEEQNPLLSYLIQDPALHFLFKVTLPFLILFLCIFIYFTERRYAGSLSPPSMTLLELAKISIFIFLFTDCIIYTSIIVNNLFLISG